jgi:hypothetical protein
VRRRGRGGYGIEQHLQWAMAAASAQPESRVLAHPIEIAAGDPTAGTGTLPESDNGHRCSLGEWQNHRGIPILQGPAPMMMNQMEAGQ